MLSEEAVRHALSILEAARAAGGPVLMLTRSFADVEQLALAMGEFDNAVIFHRRGESLEAAKEAFRHTPNGAGVLITPSAWQGENLFIRQLVILRMPNSPPDHMQPNSQNYVQALSECLKTLAQGIGRAIRDANARATVWICDPRMPAPQALKDRSGVIINAPGFNSAYLSAIPERFLRRFDIDDESCDWATEWPHPANGIARQGRRNRPPA